MNMMIIVGEDEDGIYNIVDEELKTIAIITIKINYLILYLLPLERLDLI